MLLGQYDDAMICVGCCLIGARTRICDTHVVVVVGRQDGYTKTSRMAAGALVSQHRYWDMVVAHSSGMIKVMIVCGGRTLKPYVGTTILSVAVC